MAVINFLPILESERNKSCSKVPLYKMRFFIPYFRYHNNIQNDMQSHLLYFTCFFSIIHIHRLWQCPSKITRQPHYYTGQYTQGFIPVIPEHPLKRRNSVVCQWRLPTVTALLRPFLASSLMGTLNNQPFAHLFRYRVLWILLYFVHIRGTGGNTSCFKGPWWQKSVVSFLFLTCCHIIFWDQALFEPAIVQRQYLLTTRNCVKKTTYHQAGIIFALPLRSFTKRKRTGPFLKGNKGRILAANNPFQSPFASSQSSLSENVLQCLHNQE